MPARPKQKRKQPVRVSKRGANRHSAAIVRIAAQPERPWVLNQEQVALLKNYLRMGSASETDLKGCLEVARRYRLDPFKAGQIWFIKRWDKNADNGKGGLGAYVWTPQIGIYGMAHIAARDHSDYGSLSRPEYGPAVEINRDGHKIKGPEWCIVHAHKKGIAEPSVGEVFLDEICPQSWDNCRLFWAVMTHRMIAKCAKAQALREAYPDLGGLYIPEEMGRFRDEVTPEGRQIVRSEQPAETPQTVAERKIEEHLKENPPPANAALFYTWFEESKTAQISGDKQLMTAQRDLLKKHWNATVQAVVVNGETLENLKFEFQQRQIPFKPLKAA